MLQHSIIQLHGHTLPSCRLHGIYPVQNIEAVRHNPQYMKLVAYFKKIEEEFYNTCKSKVQIYIHPHYILQLDIYWHMYYTI